MKILSGGLQTSFQDLGRAGYMHQGVSQSGAMDQDSLKLANWLVGNPLNHAGLEITLIGPEIEFEESLKISVCGASFELTLNRKLIENDQSFSVKSGDVLKFGKCISGARAYLAFSGTAEIYEQLDSLSTHLTANFGGYNGRALRNGDSIKITPFSNKKSSIRVLPSTLKPSYSSNYLIRCCDSVETSWFNNEQIKYFETQKFRVSPQSNRMGIRMTGKEIFIEKQNEMLSSGLIPGSIQIPNSGYPIISSVDGQTIGGYPRIANVIKCDLPLLGQLKAGDKISFLMVNRDTAKALFAEKEKLFEQLKD